MKRCSYCDTPIRELRFDRCPDCDALACDEQCVKAHQREDHSEDARVKVLKEKIRGIGYDPED